MKKTLLFSLLLSLLNLTLFAQNNLSNDRFEEKLAINQKDIIEALKMSGIGIHKFSIGEFDQKYKITFFIDEYKSGSLIQEKVLYKGSNTYKDFDENGVEQTGYLSQIRIITKEDDKKCKLSIYLKGITLNRQFSFKKTYNRQFFRWIPYANTSYKINHKVPIMSYISSWKDKKGYIRHCGIRKLIENSIDTKSFFSKSPNYFIISYLIENE